jgi:hypothetical protein
LFFSGVTVGDGNVRGGIGGRFTGVKVGTGFGEGIFSATGGTVAVGVLSTGGTAFRGTVGVVSGTAGVGLIRAGIDGDGRVLGVLETAGGTVAVAAGDAAREGVGLGLVLGDGRVLGEAEAAGLGVAECAAVAAGIGFVLRAGALVAVAAAVAVALAGVGEAAEVGSFSTGGTNFFGGAFGGGVASVLIFVRARSAAARSETEVHPLSTFTSVTRSFTWTGR